MPPPRFRSFRLIAALGFGLLLIPLGYVGLGWAVRGWPAEDNRSRGSSV